MNAIHRVRSHPAAEVGISSRSGFGSAATGDGLDLAAVGQTAPSRPWETFTGRIADIDRVKDDGLFGLFPRFRGFVRQPDVEAAMEKLNEVTAETVRSMVEDLPDEWEVDDNAKGALVELVVRRAAFVADTVLERIGRECWPDRLFDSR